MGEVGATGVVFEIFNPIHMALVFVLLGGVHYVRLRHQLANGRHKIPQTQARIVTSWSFAVLWVIWYIDLHWNSLIPLDLFRALARIFVWLLAAMEIAYYLDVILVASERWYKKVVKYNGD